MSTMIVAVRVTFLKWHENGKRRRRRRKRRQTIAFVCRLSIEHCLEMVRNESSWEVGPRGYLSMKARERDSKMDTDIGQRNIAVSTLVICHPKDVGARGCSFGLLPLPKGEQQMREGDTLCEWNSMLIENEYVHQHTHTHSHPLCTEAGYEKIEEVENERQNEREIGHRLEEGYNTAWLSAQCALVPSAKHIYTWARVSWSQQSVHCTSSSNTSKLFSLSLFLSLLLPNLPESQS